MGALRKKKFMEIQREILIKISLRTLFMKASNHYKLIFICRAGLLYVIVSLQNIFLKITQVLALHFLKILQILNLHPSYLNYRCFS